MSGNTFGTLFAVTNFGESHGPAIGCVIDGCPPGMDLSEADIQGDLDRRPSTSKFVTQRNEPDAVQILSGVYQGKTTGTPIALLIQNTDQRSKDYGNILETFRPGHADYTYLQKYDRRDPRGGGRSSARLTSPMAAAGALYRAPVDALLLIAGARCVVSNADQVSAGATPNVATCEDEATGALVEDLHSTSVVAEVEGNPTLARFIRMQAVGSSPKDVLNFAHLHSDL
jgi:chorismate synthase